ncbi:MAG: sigma-54 dependent transcriptional regulator [Petrimonas sp.]|uniref:sigma-54-dependent transcriptional regulator n=1 Tax=Petrimonas sp. TaxID=2023866 RepID=UPI000969FC18|nr:sigma-54 dependent transcriptional regulator [Petrimonas sp.]OJV37832.1 MAG: sigma-54-dependent Fis family transcriptional regulator [Bacteroidia bacterium 43-41]MEA4948268.1 sigma-54 dependent transcriptional regulator [Petrimonas sp.]MEA4978470.1 sigma-54 dependent transcriptional regulator [Petrimonas sp.]MEA5046629.1 sigma-54 dependent transcriptional regulator [Petrimonas sp.]
MKKILLIDDEEKLRKLMARIIELERMEVFQAEDATTGLKLLEKQDFDVVICDVRLPDANGVDLVPRIKKIKPLVEIILLTAYGNIPDSVQAIKNGAFDYITKGDDNNRIIPLVYRALEKVELSKRVSQLEQRIEQKYSFDNIIGKSTPILSAIEMARKVAQTEATVLLTGETGTGKEIFAQAIHYGSQRKNKPFVAINCSAFSKELLESEFFGHKAGAFTGALKDKKGLFEEAHDGTIFLDEIGEMPVDLQAKILRVIETKEFLKIGETKPQKIDVRIIAATNRILEKEIDADRFRRDLFYRLSVFQIHLPPLRERVSDIKLFVNEFVNQFATKSNKRINAVSPDYLKLLEQNSWKGNIRELRNVIERSVILTADDTLSIDTLPLEIQYPDTDSSDLATAMALSDIERMHIEKILDYTQGNKAEAARILKIGIATLYRKIEGYKL